ncbi:MAG: sigma-54 dependent transcriptional regulator [Candidatus Omnitrophota bacterium]
MRNSDSNGRFHILIVDDEPLVRNSLGELLSHTGYSVKTVANGKEAMAALHESPVDLVISDIKMPHMDGLQLLKHIKSAKLKIPVILITGQASIESAVEIMKEGAYDYIAKPIVDNEIKIVIERLFKQRDIAEENIKLKEQLSHSCRENFHNIVGKSPSMQKIYSLIEAVSGTRATVLIHGETGTGKRMIAHAIHHCNEIEKAKPFVEVSCGALTETLLESELFGHVKGAFTGAIKDRIGRFELANGGTIFLDEIDAFSPALQVKLLRVLQEGEFERVGDTKTIKVDVRVIASTNQSLMDLIAQGKFRKDLYYRLNIISVDVPPLRERKEDIPLLLEDFIKKFSKNTKRKIECVSSEALALLTQYNWPGNVRELENVIERAVILTKGPVINPHDLPEPLYGLKHKHPMPHSGGDEYDSCKLKDALKEPERDLLVRALDSVKWNRNEAAKKLGINRTTLYKKMRHFDLLNKK